jgi:AraC-like DNA-binding protein
VNEAEQQSRTTGASLLYVDCTLGDYSTQFLSRFQHLPTLAIAIINESSLNKAQLYSSGFHDYISLPLNTSELIHKTRCYVLHLALTSLDLERDNADEQIAVSTQQRLVEDVCQYMLSDIAADLSIDELCKRFATNRNTLAKSFKDVKGMGAYAWLVLHRMERAASLLMTTELSIQSVCFAVGYENAANFSTKFKSATGASPKHYRQLHKQKTE